MSKIHYKEFELELNELSTIAEAAIGRILLGSDRINKHRPWTWKNEEIEGHLIKSARHILTHINIAGGHQKPTGDSHLDNAICRLVMAIAMYTERRTTIPKHGETDED